MTEAQRASLAGMTQAILACSCCPPDIRHRANKLAVQLADDPIDALMQVIRSAACSTTRH